MADSCDVLVYGAGSIGLYLGGRLAASGLSVHFVGRPRVVTALRRDGLRIGEPDGRSEHLPATRFGVTPTLAGAPTPNLVLLTVKSGANAIAATELSVWLPADTPVISFQNGVENLERIHAAAPRLQAIAGMVPYNVAPFDAAEVRRTTLGKLVAARHPATLGWTERFERAGLPLVLSDDMRAVQWGKLLLNLNNPINAVTGMPLRDQLLDRHCRRVLAALQDEALAALQAEGIRPARVAPLPAEWIPRVLRLPTPLFSLIARRMLAIHPAARSSMYDDRAAGRPTEIDAFCGAVVRLCERHGLEARVNQRMVELIEGIDAGTFWSGQRLRRWLAAAAAQASPPLAKSDA
jgi:2-dehydropantoate 2-reductase